MNQSRVCCRQAFLSTLQPAGWCLACGLAINVASAAGVDPPVEGHGPASMETDYGYPAAAPLPEDLVIGTATAGRAYWAFAERLQAVAAEHGLGVQVLETEGSFENLHRLADPNDPMNLALTQGDAMRDLLNRHPSIAERSEILKSIGLECVFAISDADGDIQTEEDWHLAQQPKVAIQAAGSGTAMTHRFMSVLVPELADDVQVYMHLDDALEALHDGGELGVDVLFQVHRPKFRSKQTDAAIRHPDRYRFIALRDRRYRAKLPNGIDVYRFVDIPLSGQKGMTLATICTEGLLLAAPGKMSPGLAERLRDMLRYDWARIYPDNMQR